MTRHRAPRRSFARWIHACICSAAVLLAVFLICLSTGAAQIAGGLLLFSSLVGAIWIAQSRFIAMAPAVGMALASLILIGVALASARGLSTVAAASIVGAEAIVVAWAGACRRRPFPVEPTTLRRSVYLSLAGCVTLLAAVAALAIRYSAASAVTDADRSLSTAVWAYPLDGQLHIGAQQPPGSRHVSLKILVTRGGHAVAEWNDVQLAAGHTWDALPIPLGRSGPVKVDVQENGKALAAFAIASSQVRQVAAFQNSSSPESGQP